MTVLKDFNEVDNSLRKLCEIECAMGNINNDINVEINKIKERYVERLNELENERAFLTQQVSDFAENNKHEFSEKRSRELVFGTIGFRLSSSVSVPRAKAKIESLIKSIKAYGFKDCIKYEEKVDKDALNELNDSELVKLGLTRKTTDNFRIDLNLEKIKLD